MEPQAVIRDLGRLLDATLRRELEASETIRALQRQVAEIQASKPEPSADVKAASSLQQEADAAARLAALRADSVANVLFATLSKDSRLKLYAQIDALCEKNHCFHGYSPRKFLGYGLGAQATLRDKLLDTLEFGEHNCNQVKPPCSSDPVDLALQCDVELAQKRADIRLSILRESLTEQGRDRLFTQIQEIVRSSFDTRFYSGLLKDVLFQNSALWHLRTAALDKLSF
jgi:hypothetical protein